MGQVTIQEAIKSGRPFKRQSFSETSWIILIENVALGYVYENGYLMDDDMFPMKWNILGIDDFLAEDWEVRE